MFEQAYLARLEEVIQLVEDHSDPNGTAVLQASLPLLVSPLLSLMLVPDTYAHWPSLHTLLSLQLERSEWVHSV